MSHDELGALRTFRPMRIWELVRDMTADEYWLELEGLPDDLTVLEAPPPDPELDACALERLDAQARKDAAAARAERQRRRELAREVVQAQDAAAWAERRRRKAEARRLLHIREYAAHGSMRGRPPKPRAVHAAEGGFVVCTGGKRTDSWERTEDILAVTCVNCRRVVGERVRYQVVRMRIEISRHEAFLKTEFDRIHAELIRRAARE